MRMRNTFEITKASFRVLRGNPKLAVLPLLSVGAVLALVASFLAPVIAYAATGHAGDISRWLTSLGATIEQFQRAHEGGPLLVKAAGMLALFSVYFVLYFIAIFFNTALTRAAMEELRGRRATLGESLAFAASRLGPILGFTLVASTVGFVLGQIESRSRLLGKLVASLLGSAWTLATFMALPVLVQEGVGGLAAVKRSARLFKQTWGETVLGQVGLGLLWIPVMLFPVAVFTGLVYMLGNTHLRHPELIVFAAMAWMVFFLFAMSIVMSTLRAIYQAALYCFAAEGAVPAAFDVPELRSNWRSAP